MYMSFHDLRNKDGAKLAQLVRDKPSLVRYHADYCGHCKAMEPEWDKVKSGLASTKNKQVIDVEHSAVEHVPIHLKKDVVGYPTIKAVTSRGSQSHIYQGPRDADAILSWFRSKMSQTGGKKQRKRRTKKTRTKKTRRSNPRNRSQTNSRSNRTRGKGRRATSRRRLLSL